jgi:6-phosphogluconolactonase (cycloisomerase 2 family)
MPAGKAEGRMRWHWGVLAIAVLGVGAAQARPASREVAFVSNAEGATVSLVDVGARRVLGEIDVNPAKARQTQATPNFAQDSDVSQDGRTLYVSRGYMGDVAAFDIASGKLIWRTAVDPARADHMTLSRDGRSLVVSAYTRNLALRLDAATGAITGQVATGVSPHDNQVTKDGRWLFNSSIGRVGVPVQTQAAAGSSGASAYQLTIADAQTLKVKDRIAFDKGIRPWRFTPDEKGLYAQLSNEHAVIAYDLGARKVIRRLDLPIAPGVTPADWVFDAPHHGLALSADGKALCLAGRASDYAAIVRAPELTLVATVPVGDAPGWAELADSDRVCLIANTRSDDLSFVSIAERKEVTRLHVGDGPKHITVARVPASVLAAYGKAR